MKFTINQIDLLKALQKISGVVPAKSTTPILENFLLDLDEKKLKITGTDLEVSMTTQVEVTEAEESGAIAIPARVISEMIRSLPDIPIHFESDENHRVKIKTDQGLYQIAGVSKESFPEIPKLAEDRIIEIDNNKLNRMFSKTIFAVSSDELRPALMGVFMQILSDEFRMVSTDGHRLSKIVDKSFHCEEPPIRIIIPPKAIQIALRNLEDEGTTKLIINENGLSFNFDQTILFTRLVEGQYPDYERVIPRDNDKSLGIDRNLLMACVKRVSLFSSVLTHQIRFSLSDNKLIVLSEDIDIGGEAREELSVDYHGENMEIGYNAQYIMDILKHIDSDEVLFSLKNQVSATLLTPSKQEDEESLVMLIMPIKLSS